MGVATWVVVRIQLYSINMNLVLFRTLSATVIFKYGNCLLSTIVVAARIHLAAALWRDTQSELPSDGLTHGQAYGTR